MWFAEEGSIANLDDIFISLVLGWVALRGIRESKWVTNGLVDIVAMACIGFALFRDGLLPPIFSRIHPGWGTPVLMTALTVGSVVLLSGLVTIEILAEMVSIGTLFAFDVVYFAYGYRKSRLARKEREEALK
ncbi:basic amino acid/polyamine antiporter, APA family [Brevibacterium sp. 239c]|uniref:hypothetical protein n=1 Tax=Brevibacterium sp. 239c TaxID=1965356 RepID=UPI000C5DCDF5|nr:hypothetical protein [Brevibacterium sp. 239c]SMX67574.1 basic amino acid/polyamine antiporter, APA family [Brevibacterium sp. 239c]